MIERRRPLSSAEREHVARALELSRPVSRVLLLVVCLGAVPYLCVLMFTGSRGPAALAISLGAGIVIGLLLLRRGLTVRAREMEAHGRKLAQLDASVVRELDLDVDECWAVCDEQADLDTTYLLRCGGVYVLLWPRKPSFEPRAEVNVDLLEPLGHVLRSESFGDEVPVRGELPLIEAMFASSDCVVLTYEDLPDPWRDRIAA